MYPSKLQYVKYAVSAYSVNAESNVRYLELCYLGIVKLIIVGLPVFLDYDTSMTFTIITKLVRSSNSVRMYYDNQPLIIIIYTRLETSTFQLSIPNNNKAMRMGIPVQPCYIAVKSNLQFFNSFTSNHIILFSVS